MSIIANSKNLTIIFMIKIPKFSKNKWLSFDDSKKNKELVHFIGLLEENFDNFQLRNELLKNLKKCVNYCNFASEELYFIRMMLENRAFEDFEMFRTEVGKVYRAYGSSLMDHHIMIERLDGGRQNIEKFPVIVVLNNFRSAFNVGSVFRTAECFCLERIILDGSSPAPTNKKVQKTAMGTETMVDWVETDDLEKTILELKGSGYFIIALETIKNSKSYHEFDFPGKVAVILGNEVYGIEKKILRIVDETLKIPLYGWKNSLNVGVAFGIVASEIINKKKKEQK